MQITNTDIASFIIKSLGLEDMKPDDIKADEPLFGEGLGLDSIDALELSMLLDKKYNVVINEKNASQVYKSLQTLTDFIRNDK
jgi:acyl carrier protein